MNFKDKLIFKVALALVFVVATSFALFGGGKVANTILRDYVFQVEDCYYIAPPIKEEGVNDRECKTDKNRTKRDLADGFSALLIAGPIAFLLYRKLKEV